MKQAPNITEDEIVEYLLALEEAGASLEEMRTYLRTTKTEEIGEAYLELFQSFRKEREQMVMSVTKNQAARYFSRETKRTRSGLGEILTAFTHMFSWRYAAPGLAIVAVFVVTWAFVGQKGNEQMVAVDDTKMIETVGGEQPVIATSPIEESVKKKIAPTEEQSAGEEKKSASQSDIDTLALAAFGGEETESFADEDAALDMSSEDALLDNDQFYDETIF